MDSLIVTDLIELARNQAISDAILLSGDGDLRIGVQIAQSFGVRVHLISIEPGPSSLSRSPLLLQEADATTEWARSDIAYKLLIPRPGFDVSTVGSMTNPEIDPVVAADLEQAVAEFVASLGPIPSDAISDVKPDWIPPEYDRPLIAQCRGKMERDLNRIEMNFVRDRFRQRVGSSAPTSSPNEIDPGRPRA